MAHRRKIVEIDETRCDGCGQCIPSCAEGALKIVDGKARLVSDVYCDGLGACLGHCPQDAISIRDREAEAFDEKAVEARQLNVLACPSPSPAAQAEAAGSPASVTATPLQQWPVQLHLVPPDAAFLRGAELLLVADCAAVAMADFHARVLRGRPLVIACPKLDDTRPYVDKLTAIVRQGEIAGLTVVQMEVPCCGGLYRIAEAALQAAGGEVPLQRVVVSTRGEIVTGAP